MRRRSHGKLEPWPHQSAIVTVEVVVAAMLLGVGIIGVAGLLSLALSAWTAGESSGVATAWARAQMDELLADPPTIAEHDGTVRVTQVPPGSGRTYTQLICVDGSQPHMLDVTVKVSWQVAYGAACAGIPSGASCAGHQTTSTRTLRTQVATASAQGRTSRCP